MSWATVLRPLREVPGVQGFLLLNAGGDVIARDLNSLYDDGMLQAVARRVMTLVEASQEVVEGSDSWLLRFEAYAIAIRRSASHVLVSLTSHQANFGALAVASRLLLRRVDETVQVAVPAAEPPPPPPPRSAGPEQVDRLPGPPATPKRSAPGSTSRAAPRRKKLRRKKEGIWG